MLAERDLQLYRRNIPLLESAVIAKLPPAFSRRDVLAAIRRVPRHLFVHPACRALAYTDNALPTLGGLTTSAPSVIALMVSASGAGGGARVLEVGTGTGYEAAVLKGTSRPPRTECSRPSGTRGAVRASSAATAGPGSRNSGRTGRSSWPRLETVAALPQQLAAAGGTLVVPVGSRHDQGLHIVARRRSKTVVSVVRGLSFDFVRMICA